MPGADVVHAAKAFLCRAMARWIEDEGLGLDVCSAGEPGLATTAGFPAARIVLHGNAKSPEDLSAAVRLDVGRIVLDSAPEIARVPARPRLELVGLHCHIGSQITSVEPYVAAVRRVVGLMTQVRDHHGLETPPAEHRGRARHRVPPG